MSLRGDKRSLYKTMSSLQYHRSRSCTDDRNPPSTRIHQLEPIILEGRQWDTYEMEIFDPISGSFTSGKCIWFGRSLQDLLFERSNFPGGRSTLRPRLVAGRVLRPTPPPQQSVGSSGDRPQTSTPIPIPDQGYSAQQLLGDLFKTSVFPIDQDVQMADLSDAFSTLSIGSGDHMGGRPDGSARQNYFTQVPAVPARR